MHLTNYILYLSHAFGIIYFIITIIPILIKNLLLCQFVIYVFLIYLQFKSLNHVLTKMQTKYSLYKDVKNTKRDLIKLRRAHEILCSSGNCFNRAFSSQLWILLGTDFIVLVVSIYFCYNKFMGNGLHEADNFMQHITFYLFTIQILFRAMSLTVMCFLAEKEVCME